MFYLWRSITTTLVILRMTNGHPYGNMDLLRVRMIFCGGIAYIDVGTSIARPYGRGVVLLSMVFDIGNARHSRYVGHACPSAVPYNTFICFAFAWDILERVRDEQAPPLQKTLQNNCRVRHFKELSKSMIWYTTPMQQRSKSRVICDWLSATARPHPFI